MPIFEVHCRHCGHQGELLVLSAEAPMACPACGAADPEKLMSPSSPLSGNSRSRTPGPRTKAAAAAARPKPAAQARFLLRGHPHREIIHRRLQLCIHSSLWRRPHDVPKSSGRWVALYECAFAGNIDRIQLPVYNREASCPSIDSFVGRSALTDFVEVFGSSGFDVVWEELGADALQRVQQVGPCW